MNTTFAILNLLLSFFPTAQANISPQQLAIKSFAVASPRVVLCPKSMRAGGASGCSRRLPIHLMNQTAFAGVATRKSALMLPIKSDRKLASPRIHKSEETPANRFHHEVKLTSPAEVDAELVRLKDAYALSA